jgi:molybdenum cofactor cytidylyltransferase
MARVGAVILAAGGSSRFGRPKQLVKFRGRTLIEEIVAAAKEAECHPIIVVTGSDSEKIAATIGDQSVVTVENRQWQQGIGSSIRAGVRHLTDLAPTTEALVVLLCDQPFVTGEIVHQLVARWRATLQPIVASKYSGTLGTPALFDRSCFGELLDLDNAHGAKPIIFSKPDRVAELPFAEGAIDVDTPSDYEAL